MLERRAEEARWRGEVERRAEEACWRGSRKRLEDLVTRDA